jgi:hypothetical protein
MSGTDGIRSSDGLTARKAVGVAYNLYLRQQHRRRLLQATEAAPCDGNSHHERHHERSMIRGDGTAICTCGDDSERCRRAGTAVRLGFDGSGKTAVCTALLRMFRITGLERHGPSHGPPDRHPGVPDRRPHLRPGRRPARAAVPASRRSGDGRGGRGAVGWRSRTRSGGRGPAGPRRRAAVAAKNKPGTGVRKVASNSCTATNTSCTKVRAAPISTSRSPRGRGGRVTDRGGDHRRHLQGGD